jgi:hypothetical protein
MKMLSSELEVSREFLSGITKVLESLNCEVMQVREVEIKSEDCLWQVLTCSQSDSSVLISARIPQNRLETAIVNVSLSLFRCLAFWKLKRDSALLVKVVQGLVAAGAVECNAEE